MLSALAGEEEKSNTAVESSNESCKFLVVLQEVFISTFRLLSEIKAFAGQVSCGETFRIVYGTIDQQMHYLNQIPV